MLAGARTRRLGAREVLFEQGQDAGHYFLLAEGRLKVQQLTADGQQVVVRIIEAGELCGIATAMKRTDYPATAIALTDVVLFAWPTPMWDSWLGTHPSLAGRVIQTIGSRLQDTQGRMREMATEAVERRVAHAILRLAQQSGRKEQNGIRIDFPLSRQDVAEMTATTLHTVSRIFTSWEAAGLVEAGRKKLLVRDAHGLMLIAEGLEDTRRSRDRSPPR